MPGRATAHTAPSRDAASNISHDVPNLIVWRGPRYSLRRNDPRLRFNDARLGRERGRPNGSKHQHGHKFHGYFPLSESCPLAKFSQSSAH
jgi:hypothetical protein